MIATIALSKAYQKHVVIILKAPNVGRVKTRLARDIGAVDAAWWYRHTCRRTIRALQDGRWSVHLAITPDCDSLHQRIWPKTATRLPQGRGNLGVRFGRILRALPSGLVLIVGSDIPTITKTHIENAFRVLGRYDSVLGPSPDGGYWLIGFKKRVSLLSPLSPAWHSIRWSTRHTFEDTVKAMQGMRVGYVDTLMDIDTGNDLQNYKGTQKHEPV